MVPAGPYTTSPEVNAAGTPANVPVNPEVLLAQSHPPRLQYGLQHLWEPIMDNCAGGGDDFLWHLLARIHVLLEGRGALEDEA